MSDDELTAKMQHEAWRYFGRDDHWHAAGVLDRTANEHDDGCPVCVDGHLGPVSIAATGFGLPCLAVGVERGWIDRPTAEARATLALRTMLDTPAARHRGIYYHFLHPDTAERVWRCEASSIDTAIFLAGVAVAATYFDSLRPLADELIGAAEWDWLYKDDDRLSHGYRPERGRIPHRWSGYDEGLLLMLVVGGCGALRPGAYDAYLETYRVADDGHARCGPMFTHQFPHCFADLRGRSDAWGDYVESATAHTHAQRDYAAENPRGHAGYAADCFGLSACDGPANRTRKTADGRRVKFHTYHARGIEPTDVDDGTINPAATITSLPFAEDVVMPALRRFEERGSGLCTFNESFPSGWTADETLGIEMGPALLMIENHLSGLPWQLARETPLIGRGLAACGFGPAVR